MPSSLRGCTRHLQADQGLSLADYDVLVQLDERLEEMAGAQGWVLARDAEQGTRPVSHMRRQRRRGRLTRLLADPGCGKDPP